METIDYFKNNASGQRRWLIGNAAGAGSLMTMQFVILCNEAGDLLVAQRDEFPRTHTPVREEAGHE